MDVDMFLAFTETRPDGERWELVDGEPVLNQPASYAHQKIIANLIGALHGFEQRAGLSVVPGFGVKLSNTTMLVPDVMLRPCR